MNTMKLEAVSLMALALVGCTGAPKNPVTAADFRECAKARIEAIRETPNRAVPPGAKTLYVSEKHGDDAADGLTPATAWRTTERLNKAGGLAAGTWVLFERGGVYRGTVKTSPGCTYTAYGEGPKPRIYGSPENGADPAKWTRTDNPKVWAYTIGHNDVGTLVFNDGEAHAIKVVYRTDKKTGKKFSMVTKKPFNSYRDLDHDLHFWHDYYKTGTGMVYLYSDENPGSRFRSIEFNVRCHGLGIGGNHVTVDNLCVKYVGVHGVGAGTCKGLHVRNCEFGWIGGSIQAEGLFGRDHPTRLGNAVEIYGGCDDYSVENCYIYQVYDAGVTHQVGTDKHLDQKNVVYRGNVFDKCNYSIEYFLTLRNKGNPSTMENILMEDNLMFDAGYGFCEQRPDRNQAAHIKSWGAGQNNRAKNYVIRNNAMIGAQDMLVQIGSLLKNHDGKSSLPVMEGNVFSGRQGQQFGLISDKSNDRLAYGPETQAFVDTFGKGNRCLFEETK